MSAIEPMAFVIELESWPPDLVANMRNFHQINPFKNRFKNQLRKRVTFNLKHDSDSDSDQFTDTTHILANYEDLLPPVMDVTKRSDDIDADSISGDSSSTYHSCDEDIIQVSYPTRDEEALAPPDPDTVANLPVAHTMKCSFLNCGFITTNRNYLSLHNSSHYKRPSASSE